MPKYAAVVILMQQNSDNITFLYPISGCDFHKMRDIQPDIPFSDNAIRFLNSLSADLMKNPLTRTMPDVATFAFFCRKGNLMNLKLRFVENNSIRIGRGLLFHIAPSNVPVNFAYSFVCGVLSGNSNIVRVPSKDFDQVSIILKSIEKIVGSSDGEYYAKRLAFVKYERGGTATNSLSQYCDVRIIWGGDNTIANIRESSIPPRSFDVTFADRYSICILNALEYLKNADAKKEADNFYNDTYLFDQNACSAPHLIVWTGDEKTVIKAKEKFWSALHLLVSNKYHLADVLSVDKLTAFYIQSIFMNIEKEKDPDNLIFRVKTDKLPVNIDEYRCKAGYFTEFTVNDISEIAPIINRKYQTIAYYGFDKTELSDFVINNRLRGIDRIVPLGKTTEFNLIWDGYNLIQTLTRQISIIS